MRVSRLLLHECCETIEMAALDLCREKVRRTYYVAALGAAAPVDWRWVIQMPFSKAPELPPAPAVQLSGRRQSSAARLPPNPRPNAKKDFCCTVNIFPS